MTPEQLEELADVIREQAVFVGPWREVIPGIYAQEMHFRTPQGILIGFIFRVHEDMDHLAQSTIQEFIRLNSDVGLLVSCPPAGDC